MLLLAVGSREDELEFRRITRGIRLLDSTMILPPGLFVASMPGTPSINVPSTTANPASTQRRRETPTFPIIDFLPFARLGDARSLVFRFG